MQLTIAILPREDQLAFNQRRWDEVCADPHLRLLDGKFETDHHGKVLFMPPATVSHNDFANEICFLLKELLGGKLRTECPVNTIAGVKVPDVVWFSAERHARSRGLPAHAIAPEICVEVRSPSNTVRELDEKRAWFFDAGAEEVWRCDEDGRMQFFLKGHPTHDAETSQLCPDFPGFVTI